MSVTSTTPHKSHVNTLPLPHIKKTTTHTIITFIQLKLKMKFLNVSQVFQFPIQPTFPLTFKTPENEIISPSTPFPYYNSSFNSTFNFLQVYQKTKPEANSCSVILQNVTHHSVILSPGFIGYIEVPATDIIPSHYKVNDVNTSIPTICLSYYPDLSEPKTSCSSFFKKPILKSIT